MEDIEKKLQDVISRKNILKNEPMSKHTSFKIGGPADYFITIRDVKSLVKIQEFTKEHQIPLTIIGNGSNLLVLDNGIRGIVVKLKFDKFEIIKEKNIVIVSSDITGSSLARLCAKEGLSGVEFLAGIPGTIGGAVRMNAGAYGSEIKDVLIKTKYLDEEGNIKEFLNSEQNFEYRRSIFCDKKYIILEAQILLKPDTIENINSRMDEMMKSRKEKQPVEYPSAGSTFKRKNGIVTAKLIDECGLKGFSVGGAKVSEKHAGFIVNTGNATAKDILDLVEYIKKEVYKRFKEEIELEVVVIGE